MGIDFGIRFNYPTGLWDRGKQRVGECTGNRSSKGGLRTLHYRHGNFLSGRHKRRFKGQISILRAPVFFHANVFANSSTSSLKP